MLLYLQRGFLAAGTLLLAVFATVHVHGALGRQQALDTFRLAQTIVPAGGLSTVAADESATPDQSLWAESRIQAYQDSLKIAAEAPQGILRIENLALEVPVFEGTSELNLTRGVGWIEGTAEPGDAGNMGIAGHRDGFFRVLKDIRVGDLIDVESLTGSIRYRVAETLIVEPEDVYVLDPTAEPSLTLVTCYPFYFVGHAPQRFIVRGVLADADAGSDTKSETKEAKGRT